MNLERLMILVALGLLFGLVGQVTQLNDVLSQNPVIGIAVGAATAGAALYIADLVAARGRGRSRL